MVDAQWTGLNSCYKGLIPLTVLCGLLSMHQLHTEWFKIVQQYSAADLRH